MHTTMERRSGRRTTDVSRPRSAAAALRRAQHVGFQRDDDAVLRPELRRALARPDAPEVSRPVEQFSPFLAQLEMRAAG